MVSYLRNCCRTFAVWCQGFTLCVKNIRTLPSVTLTEINMVPWKQWWASQVLNRKDLVIGRLHNIRKSTSFNTYLFRFLAAELRKNKYDLIWSPSLCWCFVTHGRNKTPPPDVSTGLQKFVWCMAKPIMWDMPASSGSIHQSKKLSLGEDKVFESI